MADNDQSQSGGTINLRGAGGQQGAGGQSAGQTATTPAVLAKFDIPETVKKQYPDLIPLILETESMTDDERQYWFQILPIMTDDQVVRLREILASEKEKLAEIDKEYEREVKSINTKHVAEWKTFAAKEKREKLKAAESKTEETEKTSEEELLKKLGEM